MLRIIVPGNELFNEINETFNSVDDVVLELEHSLVSLSKWESKFQKPFLTPVKKSTEEVIEYIKAMIITSNFPPEVFSRFTPVIYSQINDYIDSKQSATTFGEMPHHRGRTEPITSELIYFWMFSFSIPLECETWHLNRLFSLIRIFNMKNSKPKKMSRSQLAARNRELNAQRKAQLGTTG